MRKNEIEVMSAPLDRDIQTTASLQSYPPSNETKSLHGEHCNPVYVEEPSDAISKSSYGATMPLDSDVKRYPCETIVTTLNASPTNEQRIKSDGKSFGIGETSFSVNYDDVIDAEKVTNWASEVSDSFPSPVLITSSKRQSSMMKRRTSRIDESDGDDELSHRELILKIRKTIPVKDFKDEVRACRDLEKFLLSPVVLLDCAHTSLDLIIADLINELQKDLEKGEKIPQEARQSIFTFNKRHKETMGSVDHLRETIQGVRYKQDGADYEESWITALCSIPMLKQSHVGIARLRHPLNLGSNSEEVLFVIVIIAPQKEKFTKNAMEIGRTFSSLMLSPSFRHELAMAKDEEEFKRVFIRQSQKYKKIALDSFTQSKVAVEESEDYSYFQIGRGVYDDIKRRLPYYWSDYKDGIVGKKTMRKLLATVFFLYFACILPDIAFGTLYEKNTHGIIDVTSCIVSQTIGGILFAVFSGQPMLILLTTAPLALYVKVIMMVSDAFDLDFRAMYTMTGLWNSVFLALQAFFNLSKLMKYSTRSTEEIFGFFIALAFSADAIKATMLNFDKNYHFSSEVADAAISYSNISNASDLFNTSAHNSSSTLPSGCMSDSLCFRPENSVLFLLLMLGTLWLGMTLLRFDNSPFLSATKREMLSDYSLPVAVVVLSFCGSYFFRAIPLERFNYIAGRNLFTVPDVASLTPLAHLGAMGLGLCLSCLFFVDQNVSAALVNTPQNRLKKGPAYHWDLMVVGLINVILSVFTLPWVHAAIPHSPLHVKALADVEQHVTSVGTVQDEIVKVRETRLSGIFSHVLIGLSLFIIPVLQYVPVAVLQGLFLYLGLSSFIGNQMFDRMMLLFTEGSSYPPNHYVRKVPQRKLHMFTLCQVVQLLIVAVFGFADLFYLKMVFPVIILLLLPVRHKLLPLIVESKYLSVLDT